LNLLWVSSEHTKETRCPSKTDSTRSFLFITFIQQFIWKNSVPGHFSASCSHGWQSAGPPATAGHDVPTWIRVTGALPLYDQVAAHGYSRVQQFSIDSTGSGPLERETVAGCRACGTYRLQSLNMTTLFSLDMEGNIQRCCVTSYNTNMTCGVRINN